jgi:CubicO group peptidase (beta-lactamase class C family)
LTERQITRRGRSSQIRCRSFLLLCGILILLTGCNQAAATQTPDIPQESVVDWPTQGWQTSAPEAQGMDSGVLAAMLEEIQRQGHNIDSVTVIRNGILVVDAAIYPYKQDAKHIIHSCTKSIVSALIGIAIEQGFIEDVQTPVLDFFPDRSIENIDENKRKMTLENLLTMTSGLNCMDSYLYRWSGLNEMRASSDWIQFMLDLPMAETPGTKFEYCNGASFLLSAIITETTGISAREFADEHLFGPLGISDVTWPTNPQGINIGWGELRMRPQDLAKIGYLYVRGGEWDGEQIVPSSWVEESTRKHISGTLEDGYGYQWWVDDSGIFMAVGYAGQFIFVVPEKELVVVFTSDLSDRDFYVPQVLLIDYIIPAVLSSEPVPNDLEAEASLRMQIEELAKP